jgi:hypothetical protein
MLRNRITSRKQNVGRVIKNTIRWFPEQILGQPSAPQDVFLQVAGALVLNLTWTPPASFGGAPAITECRTHLSDDLKYEMKSVCLVMFDSQALRHQIVLVSQDSSGEAVW